jgi:hypothetical protein
MLVKVRVRSCAGMAALIYVDLILEEAIYAGLVLRTSEPHGLLIIQNKKLYSIRLDESWASCSFACTPLIGVTRF